MSDITCALSRIYLYTRYERFWHWLQAVLVTLLLITGFEINGTYHLLGFARAVSLHNFAGATWLVAFAFFVFWVFTTGEWKQYAPTSRKVLEVMRYYAVGIFTGMPHPAPKSKEAKHNPLQRLVYLSLASLLLPFQMVTGLLYWTYNQWPGWQLTFLSLPVVAWLHLAGAFGLLIFVIVHVYMTTTGHSVSAHLRAMCTGWEEVPAPRGE